MESKIAISSIVECKIDAFKAIVDLIEELQVLYNNNGTPPVLSDTLVVVTSKYANVVYQFEITATYSIATYTVNFIQEAPTAEQLPPIEGGTVEDGGDN